MTAPDPQTGGSTAADEPVEVSFLLDKTQEVRETFNVIAETEAGRDDNVVMAGAHLDSAPTSAVLMCMEMKKRISMYH